MKFGVYVLAFGHYSDPRALVELARETESAGWDGFFIADAILWSKDEPPPVADTWTALAAIAVSTSRLKIGSLITPLPRRRPWIVARETVSVDHLSGGRTILGVGLGDPPDVEYEAFGEDGNTKVRAQKLDEGLDVINALWTGEAVIYRGKYFTVEGVKFLPKPLQRPRIPVWVAGQLPNKSPFRRAAKWDGVFPLKTPPEGVPFKYETFWLKPQDLQEVRTLVNQHRHESGPFDFIAAGATPANDEAKASQITASFEKVGATWWLEWMDAQRGSFEQAKERILAGPPRV